jgi:hypothetical protein
VRLSLGGVHERKWGFLLVTYCDAFAFVDLSAHVGSSLFSPPKVPTHDGTYPTLTSLCFGFFAQLSKNLIIVDVATRKIHCVTNRMADILLLHRRHL